MGLFSIYTGIIYNDMFSRSFNIFGSNWSSRASNETLRNATFLILDPATSEYSQVPYPLGIDPVWQVKGLWGFFVFFVFIFCFLLWINNLFLFYFLSPNARHSPTKLASANKIVFLNSFKMKLSIIFGVLHMMFGVCLSLVNHA